MARLHLAPFRKATIVVTLCLSTALYAHATQATIVGAPPIPEPDETAIDTLNKIDQISFTASPSVIRPFEAKPSVLNWHIRLPRVPDASGIKLTIDRINESFVPAVGTRGVLPNETTAYQLIAHLRKEERPLATAMVTLDSATTCTDAFTELGLTEDKIREQIEKGIDDFVPLQFREGLTKTISVAAEPATSSLHIRAEIGIQDVFSFPAWTIGVTPYPDARVTIGATVHVDMRIVLTIPRGILDVAMPLTDLNIDVDITGPDELYKFSPKGHALIENGKHQILMALFSGTVQERFKSKVDNAFNSFFGTVDHRYWVIMMQNDYPDNSKVDGVVLRACRYPKPWTTNLSLQSITVRDDLAVIRIPGNNGNVSANIWFFLEAQSTGGERLTARFPQTGTASVPLDGSGRSAPLRLTPVENMSFHLGVLDELSILAVGHDLDRDEVWCAPRPMPGQPTPKPPCPKPPARAMSKSYDLAQRFGNGNHSEPSATVGSESFEVAYRIGLTCAECAPSPHQ
jgi:hypothetical protein